MSRIEQTAREMVVASRAAITEVAVGVTNLAKQYCPVDTGRLRSSISFEVDTRATATVGTNVEYAPYVEYGTSRMAAQPYLRPAVHEYEAKMRGIVVDVIRRDVPILRGG